MSLAAVPLVPKSGDELQVIAIGRISTSYQNLENIEASYRYIRDYLKQIYAGPLKLTLLGEQASGMLTDRSTIQQAEALVAGGTIDLVIAEDLARIYRNPRYQYDFVQNAVDNATRVICIGDNLDTADENWEITMGAATLRHGLHIPDTRRRVRRTATHSFHRGGMVQKVRYGYRKLTPEEATSGLFGPKDLRIAKLPECTPVIEEMASRLLAGRSYASIAEWLNGEGIEPGAYVSSGRWTPRLVATLLDSPVLSGTRTFRETICRPVFKTGRHKASKNASPESLHYPELAHLGLEMHSAVRQEIDRRRLATGRKSANVAKRTGVPRKRTLWPGQSIRCAICGSLFYFCGNHLRCSQSLPRSGAQCWNRVQVSTELLRKRVISWLVAHLSECSECRKAVIELIAQELDHRSGAARRVKRDSDRIIQKLERQIANLTAAIAEGGQMSSLLERLKAAEGELQAARVERQLEESGAVGAEAPASRTQIEDRLTQLLLDLITSSYGFAETMRCLIPSFVVHPVQALDTGQIHPRCKLVLACRADAKATKSNPIEAVLNLFAEPVHIAILPRVVNLRRQAPRPSYRQLALQLQTSYMTVKRALAYAKRMEGLRTTDPYRELHDLPVMASRWRRRIARVALRDQ